MDQQPTNIPNPIVDPSGKPIQPYIPVSKHWQKVVAYIFAAVIACDFIIFPILWSIVQMLDDHGEVKVEWVPISLGGGGILYAAIGAILGISAFRNRD